VAVDAVEVLAPGPNDVEMITGATISSRAVIRIINNAVARWQPLMDAYHEEKKP
jgi:Na+-translocating ferredoxin:NAD+ oxidoreductase RnfG subunit